MCGRVCEGCVDEYKCMCIWMRWVGRSGVCYMGISGLEGGEEELHYYMVFVTLKC